MKYNIVENVIIEDARNQCTMSNIKTKNVNNDINFFEHKNGSEFFPSDHDDDISDSSDVEENRKDEGSSDGIIVPESQKNDEGKRVRTKTHICYFCNKCYKELSKHLSRKHSNESEVSKLLAYSKNSEERRNGFINLSRVGDYYYNCEILKSGRGELKLMRLPTPEERSQYTYKDYGPCPDCLGFLLKRNIWHHIKYFCTGKRQKESRLRRQLMSESTALLSHTCSTVTMSREFNESILSPMKNDNIAIVCRQDTLILKMGIMQFEKYHTTQNDLIRQSMRQLSRLLIELRQIDPSKKFLSEWLKPIYFDNLISAVKAICHVEYRIKTRPQFSTPSLALKVGYSLKKCIAIQKGIYLRSENVQAVETLNSFLSLMDLEWSSKISSSALATLHTRKMNGTELLPLTNDLVKLNKFLNISIDQAKCHLIQDPDYRKWNRLASLVLSKIILFNKRRSGETSKMTVSHYSSRPTWTDSCNAEFKNTFSEFEMKLAANLTIVQIKGKRNRTVNVLLTADIKEAIDVLILHRHTFVNSENPYLFARGNPSMENIRGYDCLRNVAQEANLLQPELINGTKLRKYIATVCQIFNLTENETDWLARHLGHDIRVHREFYRLHESSVELTKISRLLLAVEKGEASKFHGQELKNINVCGK